MKKLLEIISKCRECNWLPLGSRPVLSVSKVSKILIIGQAPGIRVHTSGIPWDDLSGERLRDWLGVTSEAFYDTEKFGIMPMWFCYPGTGKSWDLPPRKECAPLWHKQVIDKMKELECIILIWNYAQKYYLWKQAYPTLTETVKHYDEYLPKFFVLPHPSPRNNIWMKKNSWFEQDVLSDLKKCVREVIWEDE